MSCRHLVLALCGVLVGCEAAEVGAPVPAGPNAALGREAFTRECATCHASGDGFDLAFFGFTDTTIVRRAVAHVDTATALDIVAHIRSLRVPSVPENLRLFQPRGVTVGSDVAFAVALFGRDAWPVELTTDGLKAIDPRQVAIAVPLPVWSDEGSNLDWMPDDPLPPEIVGYAGGLPGAAVAGYRAVPTRENLARAVAALRSADRVGANLGAPCLFEDAARVDYEACFEVRRWTSTLVAQHMLRYDVRASLGPELHDVWWDVGNAARKSRQDPARTVERAVENWATWMFLGWSFEPSRHPSVYTGGGFRQLGLSRHATFVALRSQVARPRNSPMVYDDLVQAIRFAPGSWTTASAAFGFRHLLERLESGDRPTRPEQITEARADVEMAIAEVNRRAPAADRAALTALGQLVLQALGT
jgi:hypothetical protein